MAYSMRDRGADRFLRDVRLAAGRTTKAQAVLESSLNNTKWFEYRFISPLEATEMFAAAYQTEYRAAFARNIDTDAAEGRTGTRVGFWASNQREYTIFWNARQFADELGVPYRFFIHHAMDWLLRRVKHIPRPNQLYSVRNRTEIAKEVLSKWAEWQLTGNEFSRLPQYQIQNFTGQPAQRAHQDWVVNQIKLRHGKPIAIANACFVNLVLPVERAVFEFGQDRVDEALAEAASFNLSKIATTGTMRQTPSCFGVLYAQNDTDGCVRCMHRSSCAALADSALAFVLQTTGSADPVLDRKRQKGRDRTRACREKARAAAPLAA